MGELPDGHARPSRVVLYGSVQGIPGLHSHDLGHHEFLKPEGIHGMGRSTDAFEG